MYRCPPLPTEPSDEWWCEHYVDDEELEEEERRQEDYDRYLAGSAFTIPKHVFYQPHPPAWTLLLNQKRRHPTSEQRKIYKNLMKNTAPTKKKKRSTNGKNK